jgi:hypothetical protein
MGLDYSALGNSFMEERTLDASQSRHFVDGHGQVSDGHHLSVDVVILLTTFD